MAVRLILKCICGGDILTIVIHVGPMHSLAPRLYCRYFHPFHEVYMRHWLAVGAKDTLTLPHAARTPVYPLHRPYYSHCTIFPFLTRCVVHLCRSHYPSTLISAQTVLKNVIEWLLLLSSSKRNYKYVVLLKVVSKA